MLGWQVPAAQLPEQHCVPLVQVVPSPKQLVGWQVGLVTPLQKVEQHCVPVVHAVPAAKQALAWQVPLTQTFEQQSAPVLQVEPLVEQQALPVLQAPEQHWDAVAVVQAVPLLRQAPPSVPPPDDGDELEHACTASAMAAAARRTETTRRMEGPPIRPW